MNIDDPIDLLSAEDALYVCYKLMNKFGWRGSIFTQQEIIDELEGRLIEPTPELVEQVMQTRQWSKGLHEMTEAFGWDWVCYAVDAVVGEPDPYRIED